MAPRLKTFGRGSDHCREVACEVRLIHIAGFLCQVCQHGRLSALQHQVRHRRRIARQTAVLAQGHAEAAQTASFELAHADAELACQFGYGLLQAVQVKLRQQILLSPDCTQAVLKPALQLCDGLTFVRADCAHQVDLPIDIRYPSAQCRRRDAETSCHATRAKCCGDKAAPWCDAVTAGV